jgi:hypothetical protein
VNIGTPAASSGKAKPLRAAWRCSLASPPWFQAF